MRRAVDGWAGRMPAGRSRSPVGRQRSPVGRHWSPVGRPRSWAGSLLAGLALALAAPAVAHAAEPGALSQWFNGSDHWETTGPASSGYSLGGTLGFLSPVPAPGTAALYSCLSGSDHFLSLSSSCEGDTVLGNEGYIYSSAPTQGASSELYSCLAATTSSQDYFAATSCGNATTVGPLGYVLQSASLDRYNGGVHWVTTGSPPSGFSLEGPLGYLVDAGADTTPLWGCIQNSDQFLSKDQGCEGQTNLGLEGRIYIDPPPGVASVAVYRCSVPGSDHFAADDPGCEGQHTDGLLGYALQQPLPVPPPPVSAPATTSIPIPIAPSHHARLLHPRIRFQWRWMGRRTRLVKVQITHLFRAATIHVSCLGRGAGCKRRPVSAGPKTVRRLIRSLVGRTYLAGDRISVAVTARGYQPIRARITVRNDKIPMVRTL